MKNILNSFLASLKKETSLGGEEVGRLKEGNMVSAHDVAKYILQKCGEMTTMKLQKLLLVHVMENDARKMNRIRLPISHLKMLKMHVRDDHLLLG